MGSNANRLQRVFPHPAPAQVDKQNGFHTAALHSHLPWQANTSPLMLAPMQGLTNEAFRSLLIDWVHPDVVFTELIQAKSDTVSGCLSRLNRNQISTERRRVYRWLYS